MSRGAPGQILERLKKLHPKLIDLSLDRILVLLARLGNPHLKLPPVIHIAGTNGKGSLVAYLRAMAAAAGYRAHSYISPHLVEFNERITLAGQVISDQHLAEILDRVEAANQGNPITLFEITTAAAFLAFAETPADLLILEVGLGGRLDATNVVEQPLLTVITPISLDHQNYLGNSLAKIAAEKAGIIKFRVPVIIGPQLPEVYRVIHDRANSRQASIIRHGMNWKFFETKKGLEIKWGSGERHLLPPPALFGAHQYANAATAVAVARMAREKLPGIYDDEVLAQGIATASWPARMQKLTAGVLTRNLAEGDELWLDGGHNVGAGVALRQSLWAWRDKPLVLIFGMLETKDPEGFLQQIVPFIHRFIAVTVPNEALAVPRERLSQSAAALGLNASHAESIGSALAMVLAEAHPPLRILICGSLYLAGSVLAENQGR
ncbi:MAG: folylpolyglutamate synthase/dihydrofolate synthase family protein [Candidatus Pacebacteria bacterium]|nr:folylpolyglutamate synthase/dihydrofolate synthase family protein [Candidatus Paceibacterota bacterium]